MGPHNLDLSALDARVKPVHDGKRGVYSYASPHRNRWRADAFSLQGEEP
jgi:hypothetical protein